jgi:hypothetical protein
LDMIMVAAGLTAPLDSVNAVLHNRL